jgi:hypothetical protein
LPFFFFFFFFRICSLETMLPLVETKKRSKNGFEELRASGTAVPYSDEIDENVRLTTQSLTSEAMY